MPIVHVSAGQTVLGVGGEKSPTARVLCEVHSIWYAADLHALHLLLLAECNSDSDV